MNKKIWIVGIILLCLVSSVTAYGGGGGLVYIKSMMTAPAKISMNNVQLSMNKVNG